LLKGGKEVTNLPEADLNVYISQISLFIPQLLGLMRSTDHNRYLRMQVTK
jgi:hypothetical protein